jgi:hypothetical protein
MLVLVMLRSNGQMSIIGPFKTADQAVKHQTSLPYPSPMVSWYLAPCVKPEKLKKSKVKRKARQK